MWRLSINQASICVQESVCYYDNLDAQKNSYTAFTSNLPTVVTNSKATRDLLDDLAPLLWRHLRAKIAWIMAWSWAWYRRLKELWMSQCWFNLYLPPRHRGRTHKISLGRAIIGATSPVCYRVPTIYICYTDRDTHTNGKISLLDENQKSV